MTAASRIIIVLITLLVFALQPTCAFACSCLPPASPMDALGDATAVFSGHVAAISAPTDQGGAGLRSVTFTVTRVWKGTNQPTIVVGTPASSASCGVDFVPGQTYLVYATTSEGSLQTHLCSRTTLLAAASGDLAALGEGTVPATPGTGAAPPTLPAAGDTTALLLRYPVLILVGTVFIVGVALLIRRRRALAGRNVPIA